MLADFNFLHHFPDGVISTIMGLVFTQDSDLGAFSHITATLV